MKKIIALLLINLFTSPIYAENVNADVHGQNSSGDWVPIQVDATTGGLKVAVTGTVNTADGGLKDSQKVVNTTFTATTHPLDAFINGRKSDGNRLPLNEFRIRAIDTDITGGVGVSGALIIPETDLILLVDNNDIEFHVVRINDLNTIIGVVDLTGFADTECLQWIRNEYDSSGQPVSAILAVGEEQLSEITLIRWTFSSFTAIAKASGTTLTPTNMWTDQTDGLEAFIYDPFDGEYGAFWCFKQDSTGSAPAEFEVRRFVYNGTDASPVATEPWDAEALFVAQGMPAINDATFDYTTRTVIVTGDAKSADTTDMDWLRIDHINGTALEKVNNFGDIVGLNGLTIDFPQPEGIGISTDGKYMVISSEPGAGTNKVVLLERRPFNVNYTEWYVNASDAVLDDTLPPGALAVVESTGTGTPRFNTLQFDAAQDEFCYITFVVPAEFRIGELDIELEVLWYSNDIGATENPVWAAQVSATTEGDADTVLEQAATAANTVSDTVNATEANRLISSTISLATDDSISAGDLVTITFYRDGDAAGDDLTSDAIVIGWRIKIPRV